MAARNNPHAVFVPFPSQSHINALLKLAKLLYQKGIHVTFVNTEFNHKRFLKSQNYDSFNGLPGFHFEAIPDGLPPSDNSDASQDVVALVNSVRGGLMIPPLSELLRKLNDASSASNSVIPPVSCIVSDGFMMFTRDVARDFSIPDVKFFTISASVLMIGKQFRTLEEKGLIPLKDEYLDTIIEWIPGLKDLRFRDLPGYLVKLDMMNDLMFRYVIQATEEAVEASSVLVHTFDALEQDVVNALSSIYPKVYTIGPLDSLLKQAPRDHDPLVSYSLWKEEKGCLQWLDAQKPSSVVYVNFGSLATMTNDQLVEFAMGLVGSKHPFLWIIRPDLVEGEEAILPSEFVEEIKRGVGFVASWCAQDEVLNHPAIGGFVTHSGWSSMMESLTAGVPMLCYPFFGDQITNTWLARDKLGVAAEIEKDTKREDVEKMVNELIEGEKGKKMKEKAIEWRRLAYEAASPKGSSSVNLDKLVNELVAHK